MKTKVTSRQRGLVTIETRTISLEKSDDLAAIKAVLASGESWQASVERYISEVSGCPGADQHQDLHAEILNECGGFERALRNGGGVWEIASRALILCDLIHEMRENLVYLDPVKKAEQVTLNARAAAKGPRLKAREFDHEAIRDRARKLVETKAASIIKCLAKEFNANDDTIRKILRKSPAISWPKEK